MKGIEMFASIWSWADVKKSKVVLRNPRVKLGIKKRNRDLVMWCYSNRLEDVRHEFESQIILLV